jgi:hypothetical protein
MAVRQSLSVGGTTNVPSLSDQVQRYKLRDLPDPISMEDVLNNPPAKSGKRKPNPSHESLKDKCINVLANNFASRPVTKGIPAPHMREITKRLPVDLDPAVAAQYVFDENYWKRCCVERYGWAGCQLIEHGQIWKQLFFERFVQDRLEDFDPLPPKLDDKNELLSLVESCQDYVFTLKVRELRSHLDMEEVCTRLPNLTKLDVTYGIRQCKMEYVRMMFGMKISDANYLAKCITSSPNLTTVVLTSNLIDDDLMRMLMTGLIKNDSITHLDVSHNKITNHGVRLLSKLLGGHSVLTSLNLSDNQIHAEGGRYLGRGLRTNDTLVNLNLRLNRLTDDGGRMLLEGLRSNKSLERLNVSSNGLGAESAAALVSVLAEPDMPLTCIDLTCNGLASGDVVSLEEALAQNRTVTSVDLRMNPAIGPEADGALESIAKIMHENELSAR